MTRNELDILLSAPCSELNTYWIPCTWFISLLKDAKNENKISDSNGVKLIMQVICQMLVS